MPFPDEALDVVVELLVGATWTPITPHVYTRDPITITAGRQDEGSRVDPASCTLTINNRDGRYSPRNPLSPYYGKIGRNTPIRITAAGSRRFVGEVSAWPTRWDTSGQDVYVPIVASGILRRLGTGQKALRSALYRSIAGKTPYHQWWPLEDAPGAVQAASGYATGTPLRATGGATFTGEPVGGTAGGVTMSQSGRVSGSIRGAGPEWVIAGWLDLPADAAAEEVTPLLQWRTPASPGAVSWSLYTAAGIGGRVLLEGGRADNTIAVSANGITDLRGRGPTQIAVIGFQSGANVRIVVRVDGTYDINAATSPNDTVTAITEAGINLTPLPEIEFTGTWSHLVVTTRSRENDLVSHVPAGSGYRGEAAAVRIQRLAAEEGVPLAVVGAAAADSAPLGPQMPATLLDLLGEAADADGGTLYEARDQIALRYRPRAADYTGDIITLGYLTGEIAAPLEPVEDDEGVRNDITVSREGGSSAQFVRTDGPLSIHPPPAGVGRYDESVTLNLATDEQLLPHAGWRVHLGTVDEARYPVVTVKLHKNPDRIPDITALQLRARVQLVQLPEWVVDGPTVLVDGYTEVIEPLRWWLEFNTVPGSPWNVAHAGDPVYGRVDTDGSALAAAATATAGTLSVATTTGPRWTTDPAETPFDVMVGGERMTVTTVGRQLAANPFVNDDIAGWTPAACTLAHSYAVIRPDTHGATMRITPDGVSAAGGAGSPLTGVGTVTPGQVYLASAWAYCAAGWHDLRVLVNWHNAAGAFLSSSMGPAFSVPAATWAMLWASLTAPAGASQASVWVWHASTPPASRVWHAWAIRLVPVASYASSPQTFTVTRSVNGIVKPHASGTDVRLADPAIIAL